MKTTVFTKHHIANGAKMTEFAGYNMPIEFTGSNEEHLAVRNNAGVFYSFVRNSALGLSGDLSIDQNIWLTGGKLSLVSSLDYMKQLGSGGDRYFCLLYTSRCV